MARSIINPHNITQVSLNSCTKGRFNQNDNPDINTDVTTTADLQFKTDDADSYNQVVDYFDRYSERFSRHLPGPMQDLAGVQSNHSVLDVGTGTGIVALDVAQKLGDGGKVIGIDLSDGMLATAITKAERLQLSENTRFLKMDAEQLEFENASFDTVLSLYALRHFPNPEKAVQEIHRVMKKGGHVVVAVGSRPALISGNGMVAVIRKLASVARRSTGRELVACDFLDHLVNEFIPKSASNETTEWAGHQHEFTGSIEHLLEAAGFKHVQSTWRGQYSIIESAEDFWLLQMTFSSLARKRIGKTNESVVSQLKSEFLRRCEKVLTKRGRLVYQSGAAITSAVKP